MASVRSAFRPFVIASSRPLPRSCWSRSSRALVEKPNPLGDTLELLLGAAAAALTAWQQAVVAAVFELCLVGVMVIFELLGQDAGRQPKVQDKAEPEDTHSDRERTPAQALAKSSASPQGRSRSKPAPTLASVKAFYAVTSRAVMNKP